MSEKYIIYWDAGYGQVADVVEADSKEEASKMSYEAWREDAENNAYYNAVEYNEGNCDEYGIYFEE